MALNRRVVPFIILSILQAGDLLSTRMALAVPGVHELNPLVRDLGLWQAKVLGFGIIVFLAWRAKSVGRLWAACGIYAAIVASNLFLFAGHFKS